MLTVTNLCHSLQNRWFHFSGQQRALDAKVKQQVMQAFVEMGTAFGIAGGAMLCFGALPLTVLAGQALILMDAARVACKVTHYAAERAYFGICKRQTLTDGASDTARGLLVNVVGELGLNTVLHEVGHVVTAGVLWKALPQAIKVIPFGPGSVTLPPLTADGLSLLGRAIGFNGSKALLMLGGPVASIALAVTEMKAAQSWNKAHPHVSSMLRYHAVSMVAMEAFDGIAAVWNPVKYAHSDYIRAAALTGISPAVIVFVLIAIPLAYYCMQQINASAQSSGERRWRLLR